MTSQQNATLRGSRGYCRAPMIVTPLEQEIGTVREKGFTLLELLVVIAILAILSMLALSSFTRFRDRARVSRCASELRTIEQSISAYALEKGSLPDSLAQVGQGDLFDPWGRHYVYLNLQDPANVGNGRTRNGGIPLNLDFDLYSLGPDGISPTVLEIDPFTQNAAFDDVVRANDGSYVGPANSL